MNNREVLAWLIVGLLLGILVGLYLANRPQPTPDDSDPRAPKPGAGRYKGGRISKLDSDEWAEVG